MEIQHKENCSLNLAQLQMIVTKSGDGKTRRYRKQCLTCKESAAVSEDEVDTWNSEESPSKIRVEWKGISHAA